MLKIRVVMGGREIELEVPITSSSLLHEHTLNIIKELCTQIKKLNE